jgi:hypothetical protein
MFIYIIFIEGAVKSGKNVIYGLRYACGEKWNANERKSENFTYFINTKTKCQINLAL